MARLPIHLLLCAVMAIALGGCGGGSDGPGPGPGPAPTPTPQSLTITPATTILKVDQTETFAATMTLSNAQTQTVQPTWQSDNTTVLAFENGGQARGRRNGTATIIATHQGLQATRLIRVATDYLGTWLGDYVVRRCAHSGLFRDIDFCDRDDGFYVGEILEIGFNLTQERDQAFGDIFLGALEGTTTGRVEADGRYVGTGTLTFVEDGVTVLFTVDPLALHAEGDRLTGKFTVTVTAEGATGQGVLDGELRTVVRTASPMPHLPSAVGRGGLKAALRSLRVTR